MSRRASDELRPLSVRRRPGVFRPIDSLPVPLDGEPRVDSLSRSRDEVYALAQRYMAPASDDVIEREAFLYSAHPGKHLVPFYLWLSIRGYARSTAKPAEVESLEAAYGFFIWSTSRSSRPRQSSGIRRRLPSAAE